ncbi:Lsr2 family protein [Streptomyces sp. NPDC059874]|uniref:histone-like nucleoid-structuring protein Lsr2 n=1 Tax=Streptomyces sp. NPDC059874 TaxID=3346983 RepID=UPI00365E065A
MARMVQTIWIDDLDGTETTKSYEVDTVRFGLDGDDYEIDLTRTNERALRELLAPFLEAARSTVMAKAGSSRRRMKRSGDPEADARQHYTPIEVPEYRKKTWHKRTAGRGANLSQLVHEWTLTERIAALTDHNIKLLGQYMGVLPTSSGRPPKLSSTESRFRNLEIIDFDGNVTPFGRYAYTVRTA